MSQGKKTELLIMVETEKEIQAELFECFENKCNISFFKGDDKELVNAEIIIGEPSEEQLLKAKNLKLLQLSWAGADKFLKMQGLPQDLVLATASGAFGNIISEYVIAGLLALYRRLPLYLENQQKHIWQKYNTVETLSGKNALILGTGDIGSCTAKKLKALGVKEVYGIRKNFHEDFMEDFDEIYGVFELDFLLPKVDIVVCCLPETKETVGIINREMLSKMKKNVVFVNVGRGSIVVTEALIEALERGTIKGAVLDVFENEPLSENSKLWDMKNVIVTPHIAGPSFSGDEETKDKIWKICFENVDSFLCGGKLRNVVDFKKGY